MTERHYQKSFEVRWSDLDPNSHLKNTAYMDYASQTRFSYFAEYGFPATKFAKLQFGPIAFRDETIYLREVLFLETVHVHLFIGGLSQDGSRFRLVNEFYRQDGEKAARIITEGAWMNLKMRKLTAPPEELSALLANLARSEDYQEIIRKS